MDQILLKTRCSKGYLVIYEDKVSVEWKIIGIQNTNSIPYGRISRVEIRTTMAKIPILCPGYAKVKIFGMGNHLVRQVPVCIEGHRLFYS